MVLEDRVEEEFRRLTAVHVLGTWHEMHHLAEPANKHEDAGVAMDVLGESKDVVQTHILPTFRGNRKAMQRRLKDR